jgi:hypothetical protein
VLPCHVLIVLWISSLPQAFAVSNATYTAGVAALQLSLFYHDYSTGNYSANAPTLKLAVEGSEGPFAFPIIEPGLEDYQGIHTLVNPPLSAMLLPPKAIAAMLMVDFW